MALRVCAEPGCPELQPEPRCFTHRRDKDKARGSRQERGYDSAHDRLRAKYQRSMDAGRTYRCWRCDQPINPHAWTLGHCDTDRSTYHGPECPPCDYATSGRGSECPNPTHTA